MNRQTVLLLIAVLAWGVVSIGQTEAKAVLEQTLQSASHSLHSGTSDSPPPSKVPDTMLSDLLASRALQPCWMRSLQPQRQIYGFSSTGHGIKLAASRDDKLAQQNGQPKLATLESLAGSLSSLCPPGLILRL